MDRSLTNAMASARLRLRLAMMGLSSPRGRIGRGGVNNGVGECPWQYLRGPHPQGQGCISGL